MFIDNLKDKVKKARLLAGGSEVKIETPWTVKDNESGIYLNIPGSPELPDELNTVIELELI